MRIESFNSGGVDVVVEVEDWVSMKKTLVRVVRTDRFPRLEARSGLGTNRVAAGPAFLLPPPSHVLALPNSIPRLPWPV